jgi:folate-dependent phosphoribosylglycinamide formyltransferase PurN
LAFIETLADAADQVFAVMECTTVFPGEVADFFRKSEVMQRYFSRVTAAEREVFGRVRFAPREVMQLVIKDGDLNRLTLAELAPALDSDVYVVFGASYIKGALIDFLVSRRAYNIHMGVSPYYRGSSCNFWALYDRRPEMVGATIHLLSSGLDSGDMLFHALPPAIELDPFALGMHAVKSAHRGFVEQLIAGRLATMTPVRQDKSLQQRYTRNSDFNDSVAQEYLDRQLSPREIREALLQRRTSELLNPYVDDR